MMEKNLISMAKVLEKLQAKVANDKNRACAFATVGYSGIQLNPSF